MELKNFLRDPEQGLQSLGLSLGDSHAQTLLDQAEQLKAERNRLKNIKKDKSAVARAFKSTESGTEDHASLIARMKEVSEEYKGAEASVKSIEKALREALALYRPRPRERQPPFYQVPKDNPYSGSYQVRELQGEEWPRWFEFLAEQPDTPAYCERAWSEVIAEAFGHRTRVWVALSEKGEILGGVPLTFFDSRLFGRFAVSVPYFNYGALVTPYSNLVDPLFQHLKGVCRSEHLSHIEVRTMQPGLGAQSSNKKVSMVLPLPKTEQQLDDQLGAKVRAQCKKAQPHNPEIRFGGEELLDDFYQVFAVNMRDLGTPVYGKPWFEAILKHREIDAIVAVTYLRDRPVSAGFLVGHNGMLEIPWASTVKSANAMDTNMWMYRNILGFAVREGYQFFDFGRSTRGAGTYRFKKQWGAQAYDHYWYYLSPEGETMPELNPDNPKYQFLIAAWKRLPVWATRLIGPPLIKDIP